MDAYRKQSHAQHHGELDVQRRRQVPPEVTSALPRIIEDAMPRQHSDFFSSLDYFAIATMDGRARPWASILSGESGSFVRALSNTTLLVTCTMASDDPFVRSLAEHDKASHGKMLFAGLGIDFSNRQRTKVAGVILDAKVTPAGAVSTRVEMRLYTNENMGNCPKYITVRDLEFRQRTPELGSAAVSSEHHVLDDAAQEMISQASTVFLATRHGERGAVKGGADMGLNHRGGPRGFVRLYTQGEDTYLVIPDYSGNRFYQSLGNVQSDRVAGLVFPDFETGDMLHVTGVAENLFDGDAQRLMPRTALVTRVRICGFVRVCRSLNLALKSPEQRSPYNPPLRYLASELKAMGKTEHIPSDDPTGGPTAARLTGVRRVSSTVSTFTFQLDRALESYLPGAYIILDFSSVIKIPYMHMNNEMPQLVNDDLIRTWTISSVRNEAEDIVTSTIKLVPGGVISPILHSIDNAKEAGLTLKVVGSSGEFSCFRKRRVPGKMLWIAGGIGITPFLAMLEALARKQAKTDIIFLFSCRDDDLKLLGEIRALPPGVQLQGTAFHTRGQEAAAPQALGQCWSVQRRRIGEVDVKHLADVLEREAFICGPPALEASASRWLRDAGLGAERINRENFTF